MKLTRKITSCVLVVAMLLSVALCAAISTDAAASDGHTTEALTGKYATNPNGQVGVNKTISVDGDISDWDSSMLIAQGVANDDPRVYRPNSMYEIAVDDYALYAAWDDTNLYLMWEMANVSDIVSPTDDYPISQGNLWINNLPIFIALDTKTGNYGGGALTTGGTLWNSGITFDTNVDTVIACSTNASNGPFIYQTNADGKIDPEGPIYQFAATGIQLKWGNGILSKNLYGIEKAHGTYNNRVPGDTLLDSSAWIDFYEGSHKKSLDMFYEMSIPLAKLGITKADVETKGVGVMKISTFGTSGMDSLPYDPSMSDNADLPYSQQDNNSNEKEDEDHITVPFAAIGTAEGVSLPTAMKGDVDGDNYVSINDASLIQKHCAKMITLTDAQQKVADTDGDGYISINDASRIQKVLAKMIPEL